MNTSGCGSPPGLSTSAQVSNRTWLTQAVVLALVTGFVYSDVLRGLVGDWWSDQNASHGFLVPLVSTLIVWQRRSQLRELPVKPCRLGAVLILLSVAMLIAGVLGTEFFLARSSLVVLLGGQILFFLGRQYFRTLLFPWALLFAMIPIPSVFLNEVTMPLQLFTSAVAGCLLPLLGVPVLRDGNIIQLPLVALEVADACSGIRSLLPLISLSIIFGYFFEKTLWQRFALGIAAVPISVLANCMRITVTGLLAEYWDPVKALGFFHLFAGWCTFLFSLGALLLLHVVLNLRSKRSAA